MADKDKSREVRKPIIEVGDCEQDVCCGTGECETSNRESFGELTIKIQADVKDALKGFKALQKELRETTKAARELEQAYKDAEKAVNSGVINVMDKDRRLLASIGREDIITNNDIIVEIDGEKVGKAVYPTTFDLQTSALKQAVEESNQIPDKLRKDILAKFAEDEAKIAELEQAYKALEDVPMQINEHGRLEPIINVEMDSEEIGKADSKGTVQINESFRLSDIPTKVLHEELAKRTGVKEYAVNLGGTAKLSVDNDGEGFSKTFGGPARIIVNRD